MTQQEEIQIVQLYDVENQQHVDAELRCNITDANLVDWLDRWLPEQYRLMLSVMGRSINTLEYLESSKWNWSKKVSVLRINPNQRGFSLVYGGLTQAMMIVDISKKCKHPAQMDENLVYIDYIQVAPWNNRQLNDFLIKYEGLKYFEMTPRQADNFMVKGN